MAAPGGRTLAAALAGSVRIAGTSLPLWAVLAPLVVLYPIMLAIGAATLSWRSPPKQAPKPAKAAEVAPRPSAAPRPVPPPAPAPAPTLIDSDGRTSDSLLGLAEARLNRERAAAKQLRTRIAGDPTLLMDKAVLRELRKYTVKEETAYDGLAAMAGAPGSIGPDLIYEVWTGTAARNEVTTLAQALVYSSDVRAKASPALAVALDLRVADSCEDKKKLLPLAERDGDRRSLHLLTKLRRATGCGPGQRYDCHGCLRDGKALDNAIMAVKDRKAPF
jgi:hypothetical protein